MSSRDKARSSLFAPTAASTSRRLATKKTMNSSQASSSSNQTKPQTSKQQLAGSTKRGTHKTQTPQPASQPPQQQQPPPPPPPTSEPEKSAKSSKGKKTQRHAHESGSLMTGSRAKSRQQTKDSTSQDESSSSSQEMTITSPLGDHMGLGEPSTRSREQETNIDNNLPSDDDEDESTTLLESYNASSSESDGRQTAALASQASIPENKPKIPATSSPLPTDWEEHVDKEGVYFWHRPTGVIQRHRPAGDQLERPTEARRPIVLYHDDEEINQSSLMPKGNRTSSDEDDYTALESGAALTLADDTTANTLADAISFVVYPMGCCDFDETQLVSINSTKAIQRCILRLLNTADEGENQCWGMLQSQPILMRLMEDHIQFTDISSRSLLRSQPIQTIRTWAVDDDNNFAFVVEEQPQVDSPSHLDDSIDYALLNEPTFVCYVFSSADENDDMSLKVAAKLNKQINRYRDQLTSRMEAASKRPQQMIDTKPVRLLAATNNRLSAPDNDQTDADEDLEDQFETSDAGGRDDGDDDDDDLVDSGEVTLKVRYIGKVQVPRPMGIDVLNIAIDKCLADASKVQMDRLLSRSNSDCKNQPQAAAATNLTQTEGQLNVASPLAEVKIHVSSSSVIVENERTGEIVVECRIRYLTFMGISRRDIRWCGFIMQNTTNQSFVAHCFECYPTAGEVCEAIQMSCSRMYEKMVKKEKMKQQMDETTSIVPRSTKIRDTLAKTLSKIKLAPIM